MLLLIMMFRHYVAYYGVFDGHGGSRASRFAADHLHKKIFSNLPKGLFPFLLYNSFKIFMLIGKLERDVRKCLIESFKKTDEDFLSLATKATPTWKDGSTAVVLLVLDDVIYSGKCTGLHTEGGGGKSALEFPPRIPW